METSKHREKAGNQFLSFNVRLVSGKAGTAENSEKLSSVLLNKRWLESSRKQKAQSL
jgi:hypothetical protein